MLRTDFYLQMTFPFSLKHKLLFDITQPTGQLDIQLLNSNILAISTIILFSLSATSVCCGVYGAACHCVMPLARSIHLTSSLSNSPPLSLSSSLITWPSFLTLASKSLRASTTSDLFFRKTDESYFSVMIFKHNKIAIFSEGSSNGPHTSADINSWGLTAFSRVPNFSLYALP